MGLGQWLGALEISCTCNLLKARERPRILGVIGFGFASLLVEKLLRDFKPIMKRNRNRVVTVAPVTVDSRLKTAPKKLIL